MKIKFRKFILVYEYKFFPTVNSLIHLGYLQRCPTGHGETAKQTELPAGLPEEEDGGGGVSVAVCQLPVLPPPERHRGHGVHHYEDGADEEVEEQDYAGQYLQD